MASPLRIRAPRFFSSDSPSADADRRAGRRTGPARSPSSISAPIPSALSPTRRQARAPTPIFNEKVLCGLGRGVATHRPAEPRRRSTRRLRALRNFRALCRNMRVTELQVIATAATRDAKNGAGLPGSRRGGDRRRGHADRRQARGATCRRSASSRRFTGRTASSAISAAARSNSSEVSRTKVGKGMSLADRRPRADGPIEGLAEARDRRSCATRWPVRHHSSS